MLRYEALLFFKCVAVTQKPVSSWQWVWKENEMKITFPRAVHIHALSLLRADAAFKHCYIIAPPCIWSNTLWNDMFYACEVEMMYNHFDFNFCSNELDFCFLQGMAGRKRYKMCHKTKICSSFDDTGNAIYAIMCHFTFHA